MFRIETKSASESSGNCVGTGAGAGAGVISIAGTITAGLEVFGAATV